MLTTGTGASGEIRVTSPQMNSSSMTSPSTTMRQSDAWRKISRARCLVRFSNYNLVAWTLVCGLCARRSENGVSAVQYAIDRSGNAFQGDPQDALRLLEFGAEVSVTRLAVHLF